MDPRRGFYLLLHDVENPNFSENPSWWGMLSSYVYTADDEAPELPHLALKGELLEALEPIEQPQDPSRISLRAVKQSYQRLECNLEDLKPVEREERKLLLAVDSYHERCRIYADRRLAYGCNVNEGDEVNVRIKDLKKDVSAVVRYKGHLPPYYGTMFGVEITDVKYRRFGKGDGSSQCKRYFKCQPGSGLFVSLDKLCFEIDESEASKEESGNEDLQKEASNETKNKKVHLKEDGIMKDKEFNNDLGTAANSIGKVANDPNEEENEVNSKKEMENDKINEHEMENKNIDAGDGNENDYNKSETETDGLELKAIIDELQQQLLKMTSELEEKESKCKRDEIEWEMKTRLQLVTQNDLQGQVTQLKTRLDDITAAKYEVEERFAEEQKRWKKQMKGFDREWEEFERRLLEERTIRSNLEQQLTAVQHQLEQLTSQKQAVEAELEQSRAVASQQENDFQRQREYFEYRIHELENLPHSTSQVAEAASDSREWIISRDEILLQGKSLGTGAWGQVVEGRFRGCPVAVKHIHDLILSPHNRRLFEREMSIASRCRHPCLLQFIGATNDNGNPLFVTELMDTNLRTILETRALTEKEIVAIAIDVAMALNYLHLNKPLPIIHRDISSANVLLWKRDDQWRAKVSDYGAANFMRQCRTINPGAVIYSAPEALSVHQTPKIDVFSFGLLLCEMAIRELPVPNQTLQQIAMVTNQNLRDLITQCTQHNHENRPTMNEILRALSNLQSK